MCKGHGKCLLVEVVSVLLASGVVAVRGQTHCLLGTHHDEVALHKSQKERLAREGVIDIHMSNKFQKQLSYGTPQGLVTSAHVIWHKSCPWKELQCLCVPYKAVIASTDWIWVEQEMDMRKVCTRSRDNSSNNRRRKRQAQTTVQQ